MSIFSLLFVLVRSPRSIVDLTMYKLLLFDEQSIISPYVLINLSVRRRDNKLRVFPF